MPGRYRLLLTCEHAGNNVPASYRTLFHGRGHELASHRGWDIGALELAQNLQRGLRAPLMFDRTTRLLVDLNRSLRSPTLFSEFSDRLNAAAKRETLSRHHAPHWKRVEQTVARWTVFPDAPVLHLAVHTFTPRLRGEVRRADVGLLYDPRRPLEAEFCARWQQALSEKAAELRVRLNYPYRGAGVGMATQLRKRFPAARYLGVSVEVNQRWPIADGQGWRQVQAALLESLRRCMDAAC